MALHSARLRILSVLLFTLLLAFNPSRVQASHSTRLPSLQEFIEIVHTGEGSAPSGIYIPDVLASPIVSQPDDDPAYVSDLENTLTRFRPASEAGSTGLLAHNTLAGKDFFRVQTQQLIYLVYGDGHTQTFIVTQLLHFQALDPDNFLSSFLDLEHGDLVSASRLFSLVYERPGDVILQTCIYSGPVASWGRLFVIAEPFHAPIPVAGNPPLKR